MINKFKKKEKLNINRLKRIEVMLRQNNKVNKIIMIGGPDS